jgi:malate dehydrogenase (oxaloacetate-decarboxylating)(NADP+)
LVNIDFLNVLKSLAQQINDNDLRSGRLYPPQKDIAEVSIKVASDIAYWYYNNGKATMYPVPKNLEEYIRNQLYTTNYTSYVPNTWKWPVDHVKPRSYDQVKK